MFVCVQSSKLYNFCVCGFSAFSQIQLKITNLDTNVYSILKRVLGFPFWVLCFLYAAAATAKTTRAKKKKLFFLTCCKELICHKSVYLSLCLRESESKSLCFLNFLTFWTKNFSLFAFHKGTKQKPPVANLWGGCLSLAEETANAFFSKRQ